MAEIPILLFLLLIPFATGLVSLRWALQWAYDDKIPWNKASWVMLGMTLLQAFSLIVLNFFSKEARLSNEQYDVGLLICFVISTVYMGYVLKLSVTGSLGASVAVWLGQIIFTSVAIVAGMLLGMGWVKLGL